MITVAEEVEVTMYEDEVEIAEEISLEMKTSLELSRMLRCLIVVDLIISGFFIICINPYFTIALCFIPLGYWGTKTFNKNVLFIFLKYVFAINAIRIYTVIKLENTMRNELYSKVYSKVLTWCAFFELWLLYALYLLIRKIIHLTSEEIKELRFLSLRL